MDDTKGASARGWHDDPIETAAQDKLGRAAVAERLAGLIGDGHSSDSSTVYGLEGPWGCGKTSVIAMITTELRSRPETWKVVAFTPWATTGTDGMLSEFFAALASAAPETAGSKQFRAKLSEYMQIARPFAALIPVAGGAAAEATKILEKRLEKPWKQLFDELSQEIQDLGAPVLVVVDDIDRLQSGELLDLLKVVRLIGRFPGVDFLLAYDEQTLVEILQGSGHGALSRARARAFMEKIVQYPLSIPPLLISQIIRLLDDGLTEILTEQRIEERFHRQRFSDVLQTTMPSQLRTPRAIERFLAQVREEMPLHDASEIDDTDLVLAAFLRVQFPEVFSRLQDWKRKLTNSEGFRTEALYRPSDEKTVDWNSLVYDPEQPRNERDALAVLRAIFPAIDGPGRMRAAPRFANPDYFDRYLAQAIPPGDVRDSDVSQALVEAAEGSSTLLRVLVCGADESRTMLALRKVHDRYPDGRELPYHEGPVGPATRQLLATCMGLLTDMRDLPGRLWSPYSAIRGWACLLLQRLLIESPDVNLDEELAECRNDSSRVHVLTGATGQTDGLPEETVQALNATLDREAQRLVPMLLNHLAQGDEAESRPGIVGLLSVVSYSSAGESLAQGIQQGIQKGTFSGEDVAARLVSFSYVIGGSGQPAHCAFDGRLFTALTGMPARSIEHMDCGDWKDTSWARRREFASALVGGEGDGTPT